MSNEQVPQTQKKLTTGQRIGAVATGVALATGIVAGGVALNKSPEGAKATLSAENNSERNEFLASIANPKVDDQPKVASATFSLLEGATVTNETGTVTKVSKRIDGILNPAWVPASQGQSTELCYTSSKSQATCFDLSENKNYIVVSKQGDDKLLHEVPLDTIKPEDAVTARVTGVEGDGFAFGKVGSEEGYIASRPTMEGDTLTNLPS